ncbi:hypothetical protein [Vreelandella titanicae]|uniref:hypothetical protein n=1 Tax=Vreelandella titanicae TaxID=664683 RepID=UPI0015947815|nr:hypothetical protein [Halomonas titanicae]NVE89242.1 hypothetical protein [Halomonas titanicae]
MKTPPHAWIDSKNPDQRNWIIHYLNSRHVGFQEALRDGWLSQTGSDDALIHAIEKNMHDPLFREHYGKLKNAWRQKKVRQQRDKKSATFVLPVATLTTLEKLAKKHDNSKVKELSTVIADAWKDYQRTTANAQKDKATYQQQLKKQRSKYEQREQAYQRVIEKLMVAVTEQIDQRCALEAKVGGADSSPLEAGDIAEYEALMKSYSATFAPHLTELSLVRFKGETLTSRVENLAQARKLVAKY